MVDRRRPRLDCPVASLGEYSEESLDRARRSLASDQEEVETGVRVQGATCVLFRGRELLDRCRQTRTRLAEGSWPGAWLE